MDVLRSARIIAVEPTYFDMTRFEVSPRAISRKAKKVYANALRVGFFSHQGYAYYPSEVAPRAQGLGARDLLAEFTEACAADRLLLIVYTNSRFDTEMAKKHPDWVTNFSGKPFRLEGLPLYGMCLSSPYLDYYISILKEIVSRYHPRVFYVDNYVISFYCQCQFCIAECKRELGFLPPEEPNWESDEWPQYREWVIVRNFKGAERIAGTAKGIDPNIKVVFNRGSFWYCHSYPPGQTRDIASRAGDALHMEANVRAYGQPFSHIDEVCMFGQATGRPTLVWVEYNMLPWSHISCPPAEIEIKAMKVFAGNGRPVLWTLPRFPDCDERGLEGLKKVYGIARNYSQYFDNKKPYPFACLLFSHFTNDNYAGSREPGWEIPPSGRALAYRQCFRGFLELLQRDHIPFSIEVDQFLTSQTLKKYPLAILPNAAAMSEEVAEILRNYVREGGLVIATYETSLYDRDGKVRQNFSLGDVFGCNLSSRLERSGRAEEHAVYVELAKRRWLGLPLGLRLPVAGECLGVKAQRGVESGGVLLSPTRYYCDFPGRPTDFPGALLNRYGKGLALYLPWEFGRAYAERGFPDYEKIVQAFITTFSRKLPLKTDLPATVEVSLSEVDDGWLLFIINMTAHLEKPVERVAEIRGAQIQLNQAAMGMVKSARSLVTGRKYRLSSKRAWVELKIGCLETFDVIHILAEKGPPGKQDV